MNVSRFVSFAAAVAISAIQWTALSGSAAAHAHPVRIVAVDGSLPTVIVTAHRPS